MLCYATQGQSPDCITVLRTGITCTLRAHVWALYHCIGANTAQYMYSTFFAVFLLYQYRYCIANTQDFLPNLVKTRSLNVSKRDCWGTECTKCALPPQHGAREAVSPR